MFIGFMKLISIKEVAEKWSIPLGTLRNWCSSNKITYIKLGRHIMFEEPVLDKFLEEQTRKAKTGTECS